MIHVVIPGDPIPQGRPRGRLIHRKGCPVNRKAGGCRCSPFVTIYEPGKSKKWKKEVSAIMQHTVRELVRASPLPSPFPLTKAIELMVLGVYELPKSKRRKTTIPQRAYYLGKQDIDNVLKIVMDAANGIIWADDMQVARTTVDLIVGEQDESPRLEMFVREQYPYEIGRVPRSLSIYMPAKPLNPGVFDVHGTVDDNPLYTPPFAPEPIPTDHQKRRFEDDHKP